MEMSTPRFDLPRLLTALCMAWSLLFAAPLLAQDGPRFPPPERIERATEKDADGVEQWAKWPAVKCVSCNGAGKIKCVTCSHFPKDAKVCPECDRKDEKLLTECRVCNGKGALPDPLEWAPCAGCMGAGFLLCTVCNGYGKLKVGGAKRWSDCAACRGAGGFDCGGCDGKRHMSTLQLKPSLAEAPLDKLQKAREDLDATLAAVEKFVPVGGVKARKAVKDLGNAYASGKKLHPGLKALPASTKAYMGKIFAGKQFAGSEENELETMKMLKRNAEHYLKHQRRMLELAIRRAELNATKG